MLFVLELKVPDVPEPPQLGWVRTPWMNLLAGSSGAFVGPCWSSGDAQKLMMIDFMCSESGHLDLTLMLQAQTHKKDVFFSSFQM